MMPNVYNQRSHSSVSRRETETNASFGIGIIDYGMGNIYSVKKALEFFGQKTRVISRPQDIRRYNKIVLPGVGAFDDAITQLQKQDLIFALKEHIKNKKVLLGICLGMQLLFEGSDEAKKKNGLGIIKGKVKRFAAIRGLKVPHIGWNQLRLKNTCPLLKDIPDNAYVYFCHSYYSVPWDKNVIVATCDYGREFAAVVWQDNVYGVQFHPEKSQQIGLKVLENFIKLC
ncbi:MAG: imidazole glycerol phosphate synthase subunit HisH [Candidatus Omnitrophica bacterium]|nr:imidazole glycerol phosphate synthase subunit HisH [Candidatus Omnitrophota bacterium]